jgi:hypothetical protein
MLLLTWHILTPVCWQVAQLLQTHKLTLYLPEAPNFSRSFDRLTFAHTYRCLRRHLDAPCEASSDAHDWGSLESRFVGAFSFFSVLLTVVPFFLVLGFSVFQLADHQIWESRSAYLHLSAAYDEGSTGIKPNSHHQNRHFFVVYCDSAPTLIQCHRLSQCPNATLHKSILEFSAKQISHGFYTWSVRVYFCHSQLIS